MDFSENSNVNNLIYSGYQDNMCRIWKFDEQKKELNKINEFYPHLDSIKNIALDGDIKLFTTCARVFLKK